MQWPQCGVFGEQRTEQSAATVAAKRRMPRASIIKTESPCLERSSMASRIKFGHCVVFPDPVSPATMTWARSLQGFRIFAARPGGRLAATVTCSIFHVVCWFAKRSVTCTEQNKPGEVSTALQGVPPPGVPAALRGRPPAPLLFRRSLPFYNHSRLRVFACFPLDCARVCESREEPNAHYALPLRQVMLPGSVLTLNPAKSTGDRNSIGAAAEQAVVLALVLLRRSLETQT